MQSTLWLIDEYLKLFFNLVLVDIKSKKMVKYHVVDIHEYLSRDRSPGVSATRALNSAIGCTEFSLSRSASQYNKYAKTVSTHEMCAGLYLRIYVYLLNQYGKYS